MIRTNQPFGRQLKLSVCGASHAPAMTFILAGFPRGFRVDEAALARFMARRAPGQDALSTARRETDALVLTQGLSAGVTTGEPLVGRIENHDQRPTDYGAARTIPRPGHADFPQWVETGRIPTGGGKNSGRLTAALCGAGGLCLQYLAQRGISISARILSIGGRTTDFEATVLAAKAAGDSVGGQIVCEVTGLPVGLGGALFEGLESDLAAALFAIPGVKGLSFGNGFACEALRGSENDDPFALEAGKVVTTSNRHGGLLGGRTSGMPLVLTVVLKPTPTVFRPLPSVDLATMRPALCAMKGRHDPCLVFRALPVVEAVCALVLMDALVATEAASPRVCLTLTGQTLAEDVAQWQSQRYFVDLVELRVDLLREEERARVHEFPARVAVPVLLTFRRRRDGGAFEGSEETREAFFRTALSKAHFALVDFEEDFRIAELSALAAQVGTRIIRSLHAFTGPVPHLLARCRQLRGDTEEVPKIAFMPRGPADVASLFEAASGEEDLPRILCAMGPCGVASRVLAARTRSLLTYTSVGGLGSLGHLSPEELVRTYRVRAITREAQLYVVTGYPLVFTRSPEINNAAFAAADEEAVMVPMPAATAAEAIDFFKRMKVCGMAVTYPHKQAVMSFLEAIDPVAATLGAVNTIVRERRGLVGYNTDVTGFTQALLVFLGVTTLAGRRAAVIGAGGAARAVVYSLLALGAEVCIFNRTSEKAAALAATFQCEWAPLGVSALEKLSAYGDIMVQCASPGSDPAHFDPLAFYPFTGREWVYDLVYEPEETPTLARAAAAGCATANGFSMLCEQAKAQRRLFRAAAEAWAYGGEQLEKEEKGK